MALTAVPGGAVRVPFRAPRDSSLALRPGAWSLVVLVSLVWLSIWARGTYVIRAEPPREGGATKPRSDPARPEKVAPPPLRVVVVHRRPGAPDPAPPRRGSRHPGFGDDMLEDKNAPRALRRAIDDLLGDIEDKREDGRGEDRQ